MYKLHSQTSQFRLKSGEGFPKRPKRKYIHKIRLTRNKTPNRYHRKSCTQKNVWCKYQPKVEDEDGVRTSLMDVMMVAAKYDKFKKIMFVTY